MTSELTGISENLKGMIADQDSQIRIVIQTGYDEAGMIATTDGYLRLAQFLIDFVLKAKTQDMEVWDIYGSPLPGSSAIGYLFNGTDEVRIDSVMLAATEDDVNQMSQAFRINSPPS